MQYSQPLVSVVIPSYNHEQFVKDSIQSVIDQDYENIELIIIDDGSQDDSVLKIQEMMESCKKRFVRFEFRNRGNKGLCATLNEALEWCEGDYFCPLASDDIALAHKTRYLVNKIYNSDYSVVFGQIQSIGNATKIEKVIEEVEHVFGEILMQENIPSAPAALLKTKAIREIGGYNEDVKLEDWYMWLKLTDDSKKLISFNEVVCLYRKHENNTTKNIDHMHNAREQIIKLYSDNILYEEALKKNLLVKARHKASDEFYSPLILLAKSRYFNKKGAIVFLKILTPSILIKIKRKLYGYS